MLLSSNKRFETNSRFERFAIEFIQNAAAASLRSNLFESEVIFVKDMLYAVLALVTAVIAAGSFYFYVSGGGQTMYIVLTIVFVLLTIVLGGLFLSGRVNKKEEIHITE